MTVIHLPEETCSIGQPETDCSVAPGAALQMQHALAWMMIAPVLAGRWLVRWARALAFALGRLLRGRGPALSTYLLPSRTGGADGGPAVFCPADPLGPVGFDIGASCNDLPVASLVRIWRDCAADRAAPVFAVVVERWLAAGWTMRPGVARR